MGRIQTLAEAESYLEGLINMERLPRAGASRFGLDAIRALLARAGDPHAGLEVVHIAGSKGKGSTALLLESILRAAGDRVGTFTNPHLERWTERFRIDGQEVDGPRLAAAVDRLRPHVDALRVGPGHTVPTFFDVTTAAGLLLFAAASVERVILEVGLGGRLDSTNVIQPRVTCITSIELEHTDKLGPDHASIAGEKAGILKPGIPVVTGALGPEATEVVEARARSQGAPCFRLGRDFHVSIDRVAPRSLALHLRDEGLDLKVEVPVCGEHQAANAALALACARRLDAHPEDVLAGAARSGLATARLPGRVEILGEAPWVLVDGAHTEASAQALARFLQILPRRRATLVLSVSEGKNLPAILDALLPQVDRVTLTRADPVRSAEPEALARAVQARRPGLALRIVENPERAVREARRNLAADELLCATGSIYLAGIARRVLGAGTSEPGPDTHRSSNASAPSFSGPGGPSA